MISTPDGPFYRVIPICADDHATAIWAGSQHDPYSTFHVRSDGGTAFMRIALLFILVGTFLTASISSPAAPAMHGHGLGDRSLDRRSRPVATRGAPSQPARAIATKQALEGGVPGASVDLDALWGVPEHISSTEGFLTKPAPQSTEREPQRTRSRAADLSPDPDASTKAFLDENPNLFGFGGDILKGARLTRDHVTPHSGMRTRVWEQELDGIPLFETLLVSHTSGDGALISLSTRFLPEPVSAVAGTGEERSRRVADPPVSARAALVAAARSLGIETEPRRLADPENAPAVPRTTHRFHGTGLTAEASVRLIWLPLSRTDLRLCWRVALCEERSGETFEILIDAEKPEDSREPWVRRHMSSHFSNATYRVFDSDNPKPMSPGHPTPNPCEPSQVGMVDITLQALSLLGSPKGWIDDGVTATIGNNADAHTDLRNKNQPFGAPMAPFHDPPRPQSATRSFTNHNPDLTLDPSAHRDAAVVNAFFWCNWIHDRLYDLGFNETAGCFQQDNFERGGVGNDAMIVEVQNGAFLGHRNGGNLIWDSTPADGGRARLQLYLWVGPVPERDGAFDTEVILHEYVHGMTWRVVGKGNVFSANQTRGLGEGWSDFYAMALPSQASDDVDGTYAYAAYSVREWRYAGIPLKENYYFGMRRYPYSTDLTKNPLRFSDLDVGNVNQYTAPRNPQYPLDAFSGIEPNPAEPHNQGEVWCVTLWDARANLLAKYGFTEGNDLALRLVTDSLNLCGSQNPNFLQARDALLLADRIYTGGANQRELWRAFAKRGMGYGAVCPPSTSNSGFVESFAMPPPRDNGLVWARFTASEIYSSPAVAPDGTIYYGANDKTLRALRSDGTLKWTFSVTGSPGAFQSSPAIGPDATVYIGCDDSYLYALNPNGSLRWKFKTGFEIQSSPAVGPDGTVYVGSTDSKVYALGPGFETGGTPRWVVATGNTIYASPALSPDGWLYIASTDGTVSALNASTGAPKDNWPFTTGGLIASSPALGTDGSVYIGCYDGRIYAINADGSPKWSVPFQTAAPVRSSPAVGPGGVIYVGSQDHKLYALNAANGEKLWDFDTASPVNASPAIAEDGTIVFGSSNGKILGLHSDGTLKWEFAANGMVFASPGIGLDGRIYVASTTVRGGNIYVLSHGHAGPAVSSWPMFRKNLGRTGY